MTRIAVVGAGADLAEDVLAVLSARGFDLPNVRLLGDEGEVGATVEVSGGRARYGQAEPAALVGQDAVLFCGDGRLASELLPAASRSTSLVLDASAFSRSQSGAVLIVPEVNGARIAELPPKTVLVSPEPASVGLAAALAPLHEAGRIRRVVATVLAGASVGGMEGVGRLSRQSLLLMQGQSLKAEEDPEHFAFNVRVEAADDPDGSASSERRVAAEIAVLLGKPRFQALVTTVRVPVFYGMAQSVYVETEEPLEEAEVRLLLLKAPGLLLVDALTDQAETEGEGEKEVGAACPGPIEVAGSEAVHVARLRVVRENAGARLVFWVCFDDQRKGIALNLVSTLESALRQAAR